MALNYLIFTDHGTFRVKADKLTPGNDFFSLYNEGKLVASFTKERVIGIGLEQALPDYKGISLNRVGSEKAGESPAKIVGGMEEETTEIP